MSNILNDDAEILTINEEHGAVPLAAAAFDPATVSEVGNRRYSSYAQAMKLVNTVGMRFWQLDPVASREKAFPAG